jgi:hypothetical protein
MHEIAVRTALADRTTTATGSPRVRRIRADR